MEGIKRLVRVDQKPIGRTPRSNLATYTGLFDHVRKLFAATKAARARRYDAGRFSFNVAKGRCETCEGEGFVMVELLFLPSVYAPCPTCHGARYNAKTLEIKYRDKSIADVLGMTVDAAWEFFADEPQVHRSLDVLREVGLGYLRLGQPATELSGGEAQRIKLATELQRIQRGRHALRPRRAHDRAASGRRREAHGAARRAGRIGQHRDRGRARDAGRRRQRLGHRHRPRRGEEGGRIVASGPPAGVARSPDSRTAPYLAILDRQQSDVQTSYDLVADEYARRIFDELEHKPLDRQLLDRFAARVRPIGPACDMGCGPGHVARYLHDRGVEVIGVDLSPVMVSYARKLNPGIEFRQGDMRSLEINDGAWGGIAAFYSLIHIPRSEIVSVLARIQASLATRGLAAPGFSHRR